jgi:tripartite-type tricarboxylate transporter receptor subunit TctC
MAVRIKGWNVKGRKIPGAGLLLLACLLAPAAASAQAWPARSVRVILPYSAGGAADALVRLLTDKLTQRLSQSFVVENKPGGAGLVGLDIAAKSAPDGYTFVVGANDAVWINQVVRTDFDLRRDLDPVTIMRRGILVAWINAEVPAQTVPEFIAYAKAHPGKLNYASTGIGSGNHLGVETLKLVAGIDLVHVPYKGESQILQALTAGEVQLALGTYLTYAPQAAAGKLRALAVAGEHRLPALPNVPTFAEAGVPYVQTYWSGFFAPAKTPRDIESRLASELKVIYQLPDINPTMVRNGEEVGGQTPEEFARLITDELDMRTRAVKAAGLKPQ